MSVDTSSFLADLLASVTEDLSKTKDPFTALDEAVAHVKTALATYEAHQRLNSEVLSNMSLYADVQDRYHRATGYSWNLVRGYIAKGVMAATDTDRYNLIPGERFNSALIPYAHEWNRLEGEHDDAVAAERAARAEIDHTDLPVGTLLSLRTKDGNYYGVQVGTIVKVNDSTYTVEFETWHPQHRHDSGSKTARLDRSDGSRLNINGSCGYRYFKVLAGPNRIDEMKVKLSARRNAQRERDNLISTFVSDVNRDWQAYERDQRIGLEWDNNYNHFGSQAHVKARDAILDKYREEIMSLTLTFQQQMIEDAGQRPEPTVPKPTLPKDLMWNQGRENNPSFWRHHADDHLIALVDDLQSVIDTPIEGIDR